MVDKQFIGRHPHFNTGLGSNSQTNFCMLSNAITKIPTNTRTFASLQRRPSIHDETHSGGFVCLIVIYASMIETRRLIRSGCDRGERTVYRVTGHVVDYILMTKYSVFRHFCQGAMPILPDFHLPMHNWAIPDINRLNLGPRRDKTPCIEWSIGSFNGRSVSLYHRRSNVIPKCHSSSKKRMPKNKMSLNRADCYRVVLLLLGIELNFYLRP